MNVDGEGNPPTNQVIGAWWAQIGNFIGPTPATHAANNMPISIQMMQLNHKQPIHNYAITMAADRCMEQMTAGLAAQYHAELAQTRDEEQEQYRMALGSGHYAPDLVKLLAIGTSGLQATREKLSP